MAVVSDMLITTLHMTDFPNAMEFYQQFASGLKRDNDAACFQKSTIAFNSTAHGKQQKMYNITDNQVKQK